MPHVTVLTAVRNGEKYLPETIASIRDQTYHDWEYILVDDASTDATVKIIEAAAAQDNRIKLVRGTRAQGPFMAARLGLEQAQAAYIVRIDGDDVALPQRIEKQIAFLQQNPALRACATFAQALDDAGPMEGVYHEAPLTAGVLNWLLCLRCPLVHSTACVARDTLLKAYYESSAVNLYTEYARTENKILPDVEDFRMWTRLAEARVVGVLPEILVYFRRHANRVSTKLQDVQYQLASGVIGEHMRRVDQRAWSHEEIGALFAVGHAVPYSLPSAWRAMRRWRRLWEADTTLTTDELAELGRIYSFRWKKFVSVTARYRIRSMAQRFLRR